MKGVLTFPPDLRTIEERTFNNCFNVEKTVIPENIRVIKPFALPSSHKTKMFIPDVSIKMGLSCFYSGQSVFFHRNGKCFIVQLQHDWRRTPSEKELSLLLQHPKFERFKKIQVEQYKQALAIGYYDEIPQIREYLEKHITEAVKILIDEKQVETMAVLLNDGIITKEAINPMIDYAIDTAQKGGSLEIQTMLMNYKAEHFGFESVQERLRL